MDESAGLPFTGLYVQSIPHGPVSQQDNAQRRRPCVPFLLLQPTSDDLTPLLPPNRYHIYAIGTQECERPIASSMIFPSKERWEKQLSASFGASYFTVAAVTLGPIHIMVFAHVGLRPVISDIHTDSVPCGFGGRLGNKGGVGVSFCVGNTSLLFVNCHLAAFQRNVPLRNANAARIDRMLALAPALLSTETRLRIVRDAEEQKATERAAADREAAAAAAGTGAASADATAAGAESAKASPEGDESDDDEEDSAVAGVAAAGTVSSNSSAAGSAASSVVGGAGAGSAASSVVGVGTLPSSVVSEAGFRPPPPPPSTPETAATARFDRVIVMGDMNYRLDGCTRAEADALVAANDLRALLAKDQLTAERRAGRVFPGFTEAPIAFRPTYKLDAGTDVYDSGEKQRIPAWTDRVLFKAVSCGRATRRC